MGNKKNFKISLPQLVMTRSLLLIFNDGIHSITVSQNFQIYWTQPHHCFTKSTVPTWLVRLLVLVQRHQRTSSSQRNWVFPMKAVMPAIFLNWMKSLLYMAATYLLKFKILSLQLKSIRLFCFFPSIVLTLVSPTGRSFSLGRRCKPEKMPFSKWSHISTRQFCFSTPLQFHVKFLPPHSPFP